MKTKLALAQTRHPDDGDVIALVERDVQQAAESGADIIVFPESLMSRFEDEREAFLKESEPLDGPFAQAVDALAAKYGIWIVYTMNEANPGGLPFNTAVVVDDAGAKRGVYRKVHLFDSATTCESERMAAGDELLAPIDAPFARIGVGICYDLRFPEVARSAAIGGCTLMVFPSAWVAGPGKLPQWYELLAARALENEMFVAGVCRCDEGYVASSAVFAPDGSIRAAAGAEEEVLVCEINMDTVERMRTAIPVFEHRREDVYQ